MGICKSTDLSDGYYFPRHESEDASFYDAPTFNNPKQFATVEVSSPKESSTTRDNSLSDVPTLVMDSLLLPKTRCHSSEPHALKNFSTRTRKRSGSTSVRHKRVSSVPTSLAKLALFSLKSKSPSSTVRSASFSNASEYPWDCSLSSTDVSSIGNTNTRRRRFSSLLHEWAEEEKLLLATVFAKIATPRTRASSACVFE